jgi:hypothetical protein
MLTAAADRDGVLPNGVTIDAFGWLDLRDEPVVVHVPVLTEPRWYIVQFGDTFDEVATNLGGVNGPRAGAYAVCGPRFDGKLPGEITVIHLRTRQCMCVVRVFVDGEADLPDAAEVLDGFRLMPLSAYLREGLGYRSPEGVPLAALAEEAPPALRLFGHIGQAMRWYLPSFADIGDPLVMSFHGIGLSVAHGFDYGSLHEDTTRGLERAAVTAERIIDARLAALGESTNGWRYITASGRAGYDVALRAALAKGALGLQLADEVLCAPATLTPTVRRCMDATTTSFTSRPASFRPRPGSGTCRWSARTCCSSKTMRAVTASATRPTASPAIPTGR